MWAVAKLVVVHVKPKKIPKKSTDPIKVIVILIYLGHFGYLSVCLSVCRNVQLIVYQFYGSPFLGAISQVSNNNRLFCRSGHGWQKQKEFEDKYRWQLPTGIFKGNLRGVAWKNVVRKWHVKTYHLIWKREFSHKKRFAIFFFKNPFV